MDFAKTLKEKRKSLGWTQRIAAKNLGIPLGTLRNWEQKRKEPTEFTQKNVINTLQILENFL